MADPAIINARNAKGILEILEILGQFTKAIPEILNLIKELKEDLKILQDILDVNKVGGGTQAAIEMAKMSEVIQRLSDDVAALSKATKGQGK